MSFFTNLLKGASGFLSAVPVVGESLAGSINSAISAYDAERQDEKDKAFNAEQAQLNRDFQQQERLAAQQFDIDMWNMNNDYNSPKAQLERAKEAGINPNAIAGGNSSPVASQPVSTSPMSGSQASHNGGLASSMLTSDAMIKNLMAQTRKTDTESDKNEYELSFYKLTEADRVASLQKSNSEADARIKKLISDVDMNEFTKDIQSKYYDWFAKQSEEDLKLKSEQLNLLRNQVITEYWKSKDYQASADLKASEAVVNQSEYALNMANAQNAYKDIELKNSQIKGNIARFVLTKEEIMSQRFQNIVNKYAADFAVASGFPLGTSEFDVMMKFWSLGKWDELNALTLQKGQMNMSNNPVGSTIVGLGGMIGNTAQGFEKRLRNMFQQGYETAKGWFNP